MAHDVDVAVVGSGFGGSVAALRVTEKGYRVVVLEKGRRWRPEDFPTTNWNVPKAFWFPALGCHGIWALHLLREVLVLHGVGVGGGSLNYACTLFEPEDIVWDDPVWRGLEDWRREMPRRFDAARRMLGAQTSPWLGPADEALRRAAQRRGLDSSFVPTDVGIYFGDPEREVPDPYFDGDGPSRRGCTFCGACMVGCRDGAKNTLDRNYLHLAERGGAEIVPGRKVELIEALPDGGYRLTWRSSTRPLWRERGSLTAGKVVLSGGVLGTVDLLLQCKRRGTLPGLSEQVGNYVRTNSEALLGITSRTRRDLWEGNAITCKVQVDADTQMEIVRFPKGSDVVLLLGTALTDGGGPLPRPLKWLGNIAAHPLRTLGASRPWGKAERSAVLLVMQTLDNHTRLVRERRLLSGFRRVLSSRPDPGQPGIPSYIPIANEVARELGEELDAVPQSTLNEVLLDTSTTAHILGGCAMAPDPDRGVIDSRGRVFGHENLYVMDGSVIGANLGVNPSLTITALAEWICDTIPPRGEG